MPDTTPHQVSEKTQAEVAALRSFGNTHVEIANYLGISEDTLTRKYKYELDTAIVRANAIVARKLFNKATVENDLTAMIFWLKTRARWRERDADDKKEEQKTAIETLLNVIDTTRAKSK
jgi:hypothetical protein